MNEEVNMFKELEQKITAKKQEIQEVRSEYDITLKTLNNELNKLETELKMRYKGIQTDYINIAKEVLRVEGINRYGEGETKEMTEKAIQDILDGFKRLDREYFGCKDYDRWSCQGVTCKYGYAPRHGSIVFRIGLTSKYERKADQITEKQINACLYYLRHLGQLKKIA
jgi:cell fate (sporulation/competence/biofilm development) regulator YmcA (YheA/YmcA/DUF963 family)